MITFERRHVSIICDTYLISFQFCVFRHIAIKVTGLTRCKIFFSNLNYDINFFEYLVLDRNSPMFRSVFSELILINIGNNLLTITEKLIPRFFL